MSRSACEAAAPEAPKLYASGGVAPAVSIAGVSVTTTAAPSSAVV